MITQAELQAAVHYNSETGQFWRKYPHFSKLILSKNDNGYFRFGVGYHKDYGHRFAWLYVYGELPASHIDHINQDKTDNRIKNLRLCSHAENLQNTKIRTDNKSGHKGVFMYSWGKYTAYISLNGKRRYLGYVDTLEEALKMRLDAEKGMFPFSPLNA